MRLLFFLTTLVLFYLTAGSQSIIPHSADFEEEVPILKNISVNQDPRIEKMLHWHIQNNKTIDGIEGYLVEIFFSSAMNAREQAMKKKVEFLSKYPDNNVHIIYSAPNFRVRIGDFRTKSEALKLLKKIQGDYPGAFIVPGIVDFPSLNQK